uniref:Uncharacterized protein n=1 Tax=Strigamia maritima TaxID=126957 RepID=T1IML7_STRMM
MPPLSRDRDRDQAYLKCDARSYNKVNFESRVKCVLVGDGAVGKTSLVVSYTTNGYPTEYVPTAFDNYNVVVTVDEHPVRLQLCDTAGQDDFDSLRPLCYPNTDIFLLCFSVVSPTSFYNVSDKWVSEIRHHNPQTPVILVGTQCDLRSDVKVLIELANYKEQPVSEIEARQLAHKLGLAAYIECSALTQKHLKEVFDTAILMVMQRTNSLQKFGKGKKTTVAKDVEMKNLFCYEKNHSEHGFKKSKGWKKFCCFTS